MDTTSSNKVLELLNLYLTENTWRKSDCRFLNASFDGWQDNFAGDKHSKSKV